MKAPRRPALFVWITLLVGLAVLAAACGGDSKPATTNTGTSAPDQPAGAAAAPALKSVPASYQPKPGDLLFYTNGSISYNSKAKHPLVVVIDAKTKQIVAASEIGEVETSPHGIGMSPDATQIYLPAGSAQPNFATAADGTRFKGGVTVVDARTLKMTQSIATKDAPHHMQVLNDRYVMTDAWGTQQVAFVLDPAADNKMINEIAAAPFDGAPYIGFPSPDGKYIYMTVRPPQGAPGAEADAWISRIDLGTWAVEKVINVGPGAVWTAFSRDGTFAYVTVPGGDWIVKADLAQRKVVGKAATGRGPYGAVLSPDESRLFVVSKGEGGRGQRGGTFVAIDTDTMQVVEERPSCRAFVCQADHALISPDGTELWLDNNMGYVTVFDLNTLNIKAEITMPLLADPHGGIFVQYDKDARGHVVMDIGGPHNGVSPYLFDNQNGVPTLAQALAKGWAPARSASGLVTAVGAPVPLDRGAQKGGAATTVDLVMEDFQFKPVNVTVTAGSQVTFKIANKGQAVHNFTSTDLGIKQYDVSASGARDVTWTASAKPGTYRFVCTYHAGMEGTITVK